MKKYLLFCYTFYTCVSQAQTVRQPLISSYPGLGAYSSAHADAFSFIINPAALANTTNEAGVYSERRFLLNAFSQYTAVAAFQTNSGAFGLQADYFGYSNYNESQLSLAYALPLGSKVDAGVKFNYYNQRIPGYQSASTFYFEAGMLMHLSEKLHAGFSVYNPVGGNLDKAKNEKLAFMYRGGLGYEVSDKFFLSAEIIKEENKNVGVNAAFQYALVKQLLLRAGMNTVTAQTFIGVGLKFGQFRVDVATAYHQQLGLSPAVMLLLDFKKKQIETEE